MPGQFGLRAAQVANRQVRAYPGLLVREDTVRGRGRIDNGSRECHPENHSVEGPGIDRRAAMLRRLVAPLDGSRLAEPVLPAVRRLAATSLDVVLLRAGSLPRVIEEEASLTLAD
jgi:hypothetical protein